LRDLLEATHLALVSATFDLKQLARQLSNKHCNAEALHRAKVLPNLLEAPGTDWRSLQH